jgi:adenylosuccinate synthase
LNGATELALTKLDVLDTLPAVKICVGYRRESTGDRMWHYWEGDAHWLEACKPVYLEMKGWQQSTRAIRNIAQLPLAAQAYVRKIEELVSVPVSFVSVGPGREETISLV